MKRTIKILIIFTSVFLLLGCSKNMTNNNRTDEIFQTQKNILDSSINKVDLTQEEINAEIMAKYKIEFGKFNYYTNLNNTEFIVSLPKTDNNQPINKKAYKYNIETKEISEILSPTQDKNIFHKIYSFDNKWVIWIEKNEEIINKIGNGQYIIGVYDIIKNERYTIEDLYLEDYPSDINYSNNKIVYSYVTEKNSKFNQVIKSYDLNKHIEKIEYELESKTIGISLSQPYIFNDVIAFVEYTNKDNTSDLYYYKVNDKPKVIQEKMKKKSSEEQLFINKNNIYRVRKVINSNGEPYKEILKYNLDGKAENLIFKETNDVTIDFIDDNYIYLTGKNGTRAISINSVRVDKDNIPSLYCNNNDTLIKISNEYILLLKIEGIKQAGYLLRLNKT